MNILFGTPYYKPYFGGIERVIEQLSQVYRSQGHSTSVITTKWEFPRIFHTEWSSVVEYEEARVYRIHTIPNRTIPFFQAPLVWLNISQLHSTLDDIKPDVIILMSDKWIVGNFLLLRWAMKNNVPVIYSLSFHTLSFKQHILKPINRYLTNRSNMVHVITEKEKCAVKDAYNTKDELLQVIPWGANTNDNTERILQSGEFNIISVGRISHHKGQLITARIFQQALIEKRTQYTMIGTVEDAEVAKEIRTLRLPKNKSISITGHISDEEMDRLYRRADLFVLSPEYEAFGLVFIEALSRGVPVLTHDVGAIREVIGECESVNIVSAYDEHAFIKEVEKYSALSNDKRNELSDIARSFIKDRFDWEKTAKKFLENIHTS